MSDILKPAESTTTYTELRAAADELLDYVSFASFSELTETKIGINEATSKYHGKSESAKICEQLMGSNVPAPLYDVAEKLLVQADVKDIQTARVNPVPDGALSGDASKKIISLMQHAAQSSVDFGSVLTDISALFCSIIPPIEMSLCVPYLDIKLIYPQSEGGYGSLSTLSFVALSAKKPDPDSLISQGYTSADTDNLIGFDTAGMEIFCTPQTLTAPASSINSLDAVARRGVEILNPLVPLLSLDSANIQQTGINGSLYAQTKIDLKMILHDRSRLSEVEPLVSAEIFPTSTFRITYGWNHPDSNKMTGSPYAKLINAMKVTQDFAITSVSLAASDSTSISISATLISKGSFVAKNAKIITSNGNYLPYSAVQSLVSQFVKIKSTSKKDLSEFVNYGKVGTTILASTNGSSTTNRLVSLPSFYKLYNSIQGILSDETSVSKKLDVIIDELNNLDQIESDNKDAASVSASELEKVFIFESDSYGSLDKPGFYTQNPNLIPQSLKETVNKLTQAEQQYTDSSGKTHTPVVPLSAVVYRLIATPLILTQPDLDEVRIHFFSFNSACGEMAEENIGNFPITVNDLIHHADDDKGLTQQSSIQAAITKILNQINTPSNRFFGLTSYLNNVNAAATAAKQASSGESAEDQQAAINQAAKDATQLVDAKNAGILKRKNIQGVDTSFVPARIKHQIELLPAYDADGNQKKIARIIFYDERAGNFNKLANLVFAMLSTNNVARLNAGSDSIIDKVKDYFRQVKDVADNKEYSFYTLTDKKSARDISTNLYPTIRIGSDAPGIIGASYTSQPSGEAQSVYLYTALSDSAPGSVAGQGTGDSLVDDVFIVPSSVTLTMIGNTCITRGQIYYLDFNTGTTLDNAYTVSSVSHTIRAGTFTTTAILSPVFSATMKTLTRQLQELKTIVTKNVSNSI